MASHSVTPELANLPSSRRSLLNMPILRRTSYGVIIAGLAKDITNTHRIRSNDRDWRDLAEI